MEPQIIGIKQLHKDMKKVVRATRRGRSFTVVRNATPVFRIEPIETPQLGILAKSLQPTKERKYTLRDFQKISFHSGEKHLSQRIDEIVYGV